MIQWPSKDPQEVADYSWQPGLDSGDRIIDLTVETSGSVIVDSQSFTDTVATLWLSGGDPGDVSQFTLTIRTEGGRTFETLAILPIVESSAVFAFRARYPAFSSVSDAAVKIWIDEGALETKGWGDLQSRGAMLYAAHKLAESGQGRDKGVLVSGVSSFKSGTFSATLSDSVSSRTGFDATIYGREYLALAARQFAGPRLAWAPGTSDGGWNPVTPDWPGYV